MPFASQIAQHLRNVYFGGNWTDVCLQEKLTDISWQEATQNRSGLHSIATLVFHMNYFVDATLDVLQGNPLDASDKFSFDCPPINSQEEWEDFLQTTWSHIEELAGLIEKLPESRLSEDFVDAKYGSYHRCLHGLIEHCHYHLGQIAIIRSLLKDNHS